MRIVQGTIGRSSAATSSAAPARPGTPAALAADPYQGEHGEGGADQQVLRADQRGQAEEEAGQQPGSRALLLTRPEEGEHRRRQGEDRRRLAVEGAGRVDEGWVDGDREGGEQAGRAAVDPLAEQVDDDDRGHPEQQLDDPRRPFAGAPGRVEAGRVEQRRPR